MARTTADDRFANPPDVDPGYFEDAISFVLERIDRNVERFDGKFPDSDSDDGDYDLVDPTAWTPSFWTGMCWLAYEVTGEGRYRETAEDHLEQFRDRLDHGSVQTHDLGFLYTLSAVATHRLTGNGYARVDALRAADFLTDRYWETPGVIQAWGDLENPTESWPDKWGHGRFIIDCMMNLPLLYWASEETGDDRYRDIAVSHARRTHEHIIRDDGSSFHTYQFDPETGADLGGETHQGYADDSCWARGQAWGIYGFPLSYRYTREDEFVDAARSLSSYYLENLPEDAVPRWDFRAPAEDDQRDTSAAAIAACGLAELSEQVPLADGDRERYRNAALHTLVSLTEEYTRTDEDADAVLDSGVANKPAGNGVDGSTIYGDYYYLEGLIRATRDWDPYW